MLVKEIPLDIEVEGATVIPYREYFDFEIDLYLIQNQDFDLEADIVNELILEDCIVYLCDTYDKLLNFRAGWVSANKHLIKDRKMRVGYISMEGVVQDN